MIYVLIHIGLCRLCVGGSVFIKRRANPTKPRQGYNRPKLIRGEIPVLGMASAAGPSTSDVSLKGMLDADATLSTVRFAACGMIFELRALWFQDVESPRRERCSTLAATGSALRSR